MMFKAQLFHLLFPFNSIYIPLTCPQKPISDSRGECLNAASVIQILCNLIHFCIDPLYPLIHNLHTNTVLHFRCYPKTFVHPVIKVKSSAVYCNCNLNYHTTLTNLATNYSNVCCIYLCWITISTTLFRIHLHSAHSQLV